VTGIAGLRRLSGGASNETWSFDAEGEAALPLILRRRPGGAADATPTSVALRLETEAELLRLAGAAKVPVPGVRFALAPEDGLGSGYVMDRLAGETLARRILRDDEFAAVRPRLARQCGEILARIHAIPRERLPELPVADAPAQLAHYRAVFDSFAHPHPVFELAFRWIAERLPEAVPHRLVHGDFRNGNLLIAPDEGVRGVLDWEISHLGDPMEDLGWISVNSWRFGAEPPVGGFGTREDLFACGRRRRSGGSGARSLLGSLRHAQVGHHVHDDVRRLREGHRPFRRTRGDRTALVGDRDRPAGAAELTPCTTRRRSPSW
jgi:aminoglycoside phosphotransferase (APT) family kinase protein